VTNSYQTYQNAEAFTFMDEVFGDHLAEIETAGSIRGGKKVWLLARLPRVFGIGPAGADRVQPYALLCNGHDGLQAFTVLPTTIRVVCSNTLHGAFGNAGKALRICHDEGLRRHVRNAREVLGLVQDQLDRFEEAAQLMARRTLSPAQLSQFFTKLLEDRAEENQKRHLEKMLDLFEAPAQRVGGIGGTVWAALNAVTDWSDHHIANRGKTPADRNDNRLYSAWFGTGRDLKQQALDAALQLAQSI
jgi:phage/plasmid-like protein (TIGR03299 family)